MKKKAVFSLLLIALLLFTGCNNSASRPSTVYNNIREFLAAYENETFATNTEFAGGFVRNLAGLVMKQDDVAAFSDWTVSSSEEDEKGNGVIVFTKTVRVFGYDATLNVGFEAKRKKVGAMALVFTTGDVATDCKIASWFYKGLLDKVSKPTQAYLDGVESSSAEIERLIADYDNTHSFTGTWPKSSVKWSCMVQYQLAEDGTSFVGVYVK